jgi:hypothetical protein
MTETTRAQHKAQLKEAYALIKAERRPEAYELIAPILAQQPDYTDAWWLAAHASPTLRAAAAACQKVLALQPNHPQARLMLDELRRRMAIEQHLTIEEKPRRLAPTRHKTRGAPFWVLALSALFVLIIAIGLLVMVFTGENLGLPVAALFSLDQALPPLPIFRSPEEFGAQPKVTRSGTLLVGATHAYRFNVPRMSMVLLVDLDFVMMNDEQPAESVRLIAPNGQVLLPARSFETPNTFTFALPVDGNYELRLLGAPQHKSFYVLSLAIVAP